MQVQQNSYLPQTIGLINIFFINGFCYFDNQTCQRNQIEHFYSTQKYLAITFDRFFEKDSIDYTDYREQKGF